MKSAIRIDNLSVKYDTSTILHNVTCTIPQGSLAAIVGPNGSGKTTLIRAIMQQITYHGSIFIFEQPHKTQFHKIAHIAQRSSIDWNFPICVLDVVIMGRYTAQNIGRRPSAQDYQIAHQALEQVGMLDYADRPIGKLSGGQQQRVFLARALCQQADLFILDEPFIGIDLATEQMMFNLFARLQQQGKTIIVVHHDLIAVQKYFDFILLVHQHNITAGPACTVMTPENIKQTFYHSAPLYEHTFL